MKTVKKALSIFLSLTMLATTLIFADVFSASATSSYMYDMNSPQVKTATSRWQSPTDSADFVSVEYPTEIYMNVGEKLQDLGYTFIFTGHYGNSTDFAISVGSDIWGGTSAKPKAPNNTMVNVFSAYNYSVSSTNVMGEDHGDKNGNDYFWRKDTGSFNATVSLQGTANNIVGDYQYTSRGSDVTYVLDQYSWPNWSQKAFLADLPTPVAMNVHIYDKAPLEAAINNAKTEPPESPNGISNWAEYQIVLAQAKEVLAKREVTESQVKTATNNLANFSFTKIPTDMSKLGALIVSTKNLNPDNYVDFTAVTTALAVAETMTAKNKQTEVDAAYEALKAAVDNLVSKPIVNLITDTPDAVKLYGAGQYMIGQVIEVSAPLIASKEYVFDRWVDENGVTVSTDQIFSFTVTQSTTLKAVLKKVNKFTVNVTLNDIQGGEVTGAAADGYYFTDTATLTAKAFSGYRFIHFQDANGKILSTNPTYTFVVLDNTEITAVFARNNYVVTWKDVDGKILKTETVGRGQPGTPPENVSRPGYKFIGWDKDYSKIPGNIVITAVYERLPETFTVSAVGGILTDSQGTVVTETEFYYSRVLYAKANEAPAGQVFSHWEVNGNMVSTDSTYKFIVSTNMVLTAVFADAPVLERPFITLSEDVIVNDATHKITFSAQKNMYDGYTFVECGIILLKSETAITDLTMNTAGIIKGKSPTQASTGQFTVTKGNVAESETYYARSYLIYKDKNGDIITTYSTNIVSGTM